MTLEIVKIIAVTASGRHTLALTFSDGSSGTRDFDDLVAEDGPMIAPLRDPAFFARAFVDCGALAWPNGFDIDPIRLHAEMKAAGTLDAGPAAAAE